MHKTKRTRWKTAAGVAAFWAASILLFLAAQRVFGVSNRFAEHAEMMFNGYYDEPEDTLETVLIGNSHIYRYWQGAFSWQESGLSALALSTSDMPCSIMKNVAIEALKTQSPKVLVLDCTAFATDKAEDNTKIYLVMQNMKFSLNYLDMLENYFTYTGTGLGGRLQYYLPFVRFHSRWAELSTQDFVQTTPSYLNSCYMEGFLKDVYTEGTHVTTTKTTPIAPEAEQSLRDLLEWCQEQDTQVLFIASPLLLGKKEMKLINYTGSIIQEYGIDFVNFNDQEWFDQFEFDLDVDFMDKGHTNVNGSYKFTKVFSAYLAEQYGLTDHRGERAYASWDEKAAQYMDLIQEDFLYGNTD